MRVLARPRACRVAAAVLASAACRGATRPEPESGLAAGVYTLETVSGRGPASGTLVLTAAGGAERRVRYAAGPGGGAAPEYVAVGTFRAYADGTVAFALREDGGRSPHVWPPRGVYSGPRLSIRYPDPADGPDIVETYQRR